MNFLKKIKKKENSTQKKNQMNEGQIRYEN